MEIDKLTHIENPDFSFNLASEFKKVLHKSQWNWLVTSMVCMDILMMSAGFLLSYLVRFEMNINFFYTNLESGDILFDFYLVLGASIVPIWLVAFYFTGLYQPKKNLCGTQIYSKLFNGITVGIFMVIVVNFLVPSFILARGWLLVMWGFVYILTAIGRYIIKEVVFRVRAKGHLFVPAIIVGANEEARLLARQFKTGYASGLKLMGFVSDDVDPGTTVMDDLKVLGPLSQLESLTRKMKVGEVIVTSSAVSSEEILMAFRLFGLTDGVALRLSSGLYEIIATGLQVQECASVPLVTVNKLRLTGINKILKVMLDYCFAIASMIFVLPLTLILGILIKLDSKGPVFYKRRVMGTQGNVFNAFKFRTMHVNGDEILDAHPDLKEKLEHDHKLKEDPRVTRVGHLIRKYSLDEFPQFFNVLRGEMAVVGPRMISPKEMQEYNRNGMNLLTVKPGITGLWQVSGRSDVTYQERVQLDMYYIRNWSLWKDIQLIFKTIPAMISKRGAY
jgi:exopolysaccharide biosynthesis polyprenyl glycosylphosphotransferase